MEQKAIASATLTLRELQEMLIRYAENVPLKMVIEDAMRRRFSDTFRMRGYGNVETNNR